MSKKIFESNITKTRKSCDVPAQNKQFAKRLLAIGLSAAWFMASPQVNADTSSVSDPVLALQNKAPLKMAKALEAGKAKDVIVVFDDSEIQSKVATMQSMAGEEDKQGLLDYEREEFRLLKHQVLSSIHVDSMETIKDFANLPMAAVRVNSVNDLSAMVSDPRVVKVYENKKNRMALTQSLPLINQPEVEAAGYLGEGTTVAVLDTGVDYTRDAFGNCTELGKADCKLVHAEDFAPDDRVQDDNGHGTNVAAAVLGVAPEARIAALDVFDGDTALDSDILNAIDWAITHQETYNIVAINLSLGGNEHFESECEDNVYSNAFAQARIAGILPVVAAGNEGNKNGISSPACALGAVSVGAVYDENAGPIAWTACSDVDTAPDQVTCFSNSAPYLTLLAPGAFIDAAGIELGGTSQAAPHVAGAIAVLREAYPTEQLEQTVGRMTTTGIPVQDHANGLTSPRLDLLAAIEADEGQLDNAPVDPLELVTPLDTVNTSTPEYRWGAAPWATWYYVHLVDSSNQTVAEGYVYPDQLGCSSGTGTCGITPNVPLTTGQTYRWTVYGGNVDGSAQGGVGSFTVTAR